MRMNDVIVFEGDYLRLEDGSVSQIIAFANYDDLGNADCSLANGRVVNTTEINMDNVLLESEVIFH